MQDNASKVGQELLSLPPLDNYIDYQKFKNKEIQGQDALGENTNYLSLLILLKKYQDSFLTEMAHMKNTQAERSVLMKGMNQRKQSPHERRVSAGSQGLAQFSNTIGELRDTSQDNSPTLGTQSGFRKNSQAVTPTWPMGEGGQPPRLDLTRNVQDGTRNSAANSRGSIFGAELPLKKETSGKR